MRNLLFILSIILLVSCGKDEPKIENGNLKSLAGTEWVGQVYDYNTKEYVTATVKVYEKNLTVTTGSNTLAGTYIYNSELGTGTFHDSNGNSAAFEIKGNDLTLFIEDIEIKFKRTK